MGCISPALLVLAFIVVFYLLAELLPDVHALNSDSDGDSGPRPERTHVTGPYWLRYLDVNPCPAPAPVCAWMLTPQAPKHPLPRNTYRALHHRSSSTTSCQAPIYPNGQISMNERGDDAQLKLEPVQDSRIQPGAPSGSQHLIRLTLLYSVRAPALAKTRDRLHPESADNPRPVSARPPSTLSPLVHPGPDVPDMYTNPAHEPDSQTSECVARDLLSIAVFVGDVGGEHAKLLDAFADEITPASTDSRYSHFARATSPVQSRPRPQALVLRGPPTASPSRTRASLFIVNPKGVIKCADRAQRPRRRLLGRGNDPAIRLVKTFQSTDEHGEMCPANCSEGTKTMKPDPGLAQVLCERREREWEPEEQPH
ncbi:uncharacterized protein BXZ73DRAFT_99821 [Epithele typhae]|uniref:uncharacterized protein n=1 Tax=Epithele typhae TaxID=378194 RepID=UPI0020086575|nr:uncharacterized protein BXZ73DRAFT_99821 [Epithele typhae]KAH9938757.1 hypothetical protein BXZ73DRAFT_99821 [Epithele typhae]